jgi:iron-sulfur cluster assembly protein
VNETASAPIFDVTPKAVAHILAVMKKDGAEGHGLRIRVVPGGCSGYEYAVDFAPAPQSDDEVIRTGGLSVFIERGSLDKVAGTVLDFVAGQYGGGTLKFTNPQAAHTCGCGTSFATN